MEEEYTQNINTSTLAPRRNKFNIWNTETSLKNQQVLIQGLETQIGHLAKLISERPQGSLLSNTESNPREQLNAITVRNKKGLVEPEPEPRQRIVETRSKNIYDPCLSNNKGIIYEERRLQIDELDEWQTPVKEKPKAHEKSKRHHDEYRDETKQIKVRDKVLLDENDPRIATLEHNTDRETPFTVMNIFPHDIVEVTHTIFGTFKINNTRIRPYFDKTDSRGEEFQLLNPP
ncbi:hypothetical protein GOBAR_AA16355 [Gossypium barbadense]|uniref:Reverse transcriptase domain-containing protein n=1 Tax=Gossypium barbadense TaxID=3634 RepID=A0A2P5XLR9_GOSBA|nr:hypothetical protein GOBAR_AA16355 [Gossypium barbadense]